MAHHPSSMTLMTHTLWRADVLLGEAALEAPLPEAPGALRGPFHPAPAFDVVWPLLRRLQEVGAPVTASLAALPRGSSPEAIHAHLSAQPGMSALADALAAVRALGLELRDAAGQRVTGVEVSVTTWTFPTPPDLLPEERAAFARELVSIGLALDAPQYVLTTIPHRADATPSPAI